MMSLRIAGVIKDTVTVNLYNRGWGIVLKALEKDNV